MFKELCATLFILCNPLLNGFDFNYNMNPRDQFVKGIAECTILNNAFVPPNERVVVAVSVAQAILESDCWRLRPTNNGCLRLGNLMDNKENRFKTFQRMLHSPVLPLGSG